MSEKYRPPSFGQIGLGIAVFLLVLALIWTIPSTLKPVGNLFLAIPQRLGLVQPVTPAELIAIDLSQPSPASFEIAQPGRYAIFTDDYELLLLDVESGQTTPPWLKMRSLATGQTVDLRRVERGARPYDSRLVAGRPIFAFEVAAPGRYGITYPSRPAVVTVAPDYTTGKETLLFVAYAVQLAVLLAPFVLIGYRRYQRKQARLQALRQGQEHRHAQAEAFWEAQIQKRKRSGGG